MTTVYATITEATKAVSYSVPALSTDDKDTMHYQTLSDALASFEGPADLVVAVVSDYSDEDLLLLSSGVKYYELGQIRA